MFLHEFGHAFAFNGFRDGTTGDLPGDYQSTFDSHMFSSNGNLFFEESNAVSVYGEPVPLTHGNYGHVAKDAPRPG